MSAPSVPLMLFRNIRSLEYPDCLDCPFDDLEVFHLYAVWDRFRAAGVPHLKIRDVLLKIALALRQQFSHATMRVKFALPALPPATPKHVDRLVTHFKTLPHSPFDLCNAMEEIAAQQLFPAGNCATLAVFTISTVVQSCMFFAGARPNTSCCDAGEAKLLPGFACGHTIAKLRLWPAWLWARAHSVTRYMLQTYTPGKKLWQHLGANPRRPSICLSHMNRCCHHLHKTDTSCLPGHCTLLCSSCCCTPLHQLACACSTPAGSTGDAATVQNLLLPTNLQQREWFLVSGASAVS